MIGLSGKNWLQNGVGIPKEESLFFAIKRAVYRILHILASVFKEYLSVRNWKIFLFMVLSVTPATISHAFYISSRVLRVDVREISFFRIDYGQGGLQYDFIILPLSILIALNALLILMKFTGYIIRDKRVISECGEIYNRLIEKIFKAKNGEELTLNFRKLVYTIIGCFIIVAFYLYKSLPISFHGSLLMLLSIFLIIFLYSVEKPFSKIVILLLLILSNIPIFILSYQPFLPGEILDSGMSRFVFFPCKNWCIIALHSSL